jgi:hypothetical protein
MPVVLYRDLFETIEKITGLADELMKNPDRPVQASELAQVASGVSFVAERLKRWEDEEEAFRNSHSQSPFPR